MIQSTADTYVFRLGRTPYLRTCLLAWLFFSGFLLCTLISIVLSTQLLPTYSHIFTPYLKWQDALVALLWYITLISLGGCILTLRFLYALHTGYSKEMLTVVGNSVLIVRDLSYENVLSIFWLVGTALSCFVVALVGLIPEMLMGWTMQLHSSMLAVLGTGLTIVLGLAGFALTLPALSFAIIGIVGSISFCRKLGAAQTYRLTSYATLTIDGFVLTIMYPDAPESMIGLNLLNADDLVHLLSLLRERWQDAQDLWNPRLGEEIEAAALAGARPKQRIW